MAHTPGIFEKTSSRELGAVARHTNIVGRFVNTQAVASSGQFVPAREIRSSKSPRHLETAQAVATVGQFVPARKTRSSKGSRRSETAQAVASVGQFMPAREPGSSKCPRRSETAQAVASAGQFSLRLPGKPGRVKVRGVRRLHKL